MPIPTNLLAPSDDQGDTLGSNTLIPANLTDVPSAQPIHEFDQTTWGDYMNSLTSGVHGLGATGWSLASQATPDANISKYMLAQAQRQREDSEASLAQLSPAAQESMNASMFDSAFWAHPFRAVALQQTQQLPTYAAMALPAAATGAVGGPVAAYLGGIGAMSAVNAGTALSEFTDWVNKVPEADLLQNDDYKLLRSAMTQQEARQRFIQMRSSGLAKEAGVIGALAGAVGVPSMVGVGPIADTITKNALMGGIEGGVSLGIQSGATEAATNVAEGQTPDAGNIFKNSLGAGFTGAVLGGFGGVRRGPTGSRTTSHVEAQPGVATSVGSETNYGKMGVGHNGGKASTPFSREQTQGGVSQPPSPIDDAQAAALGAAQSPKLTPESKPPTSPIEQPTVVHPSEVQPRVETAQDQQGSSPAGIEFL